MFTFYILTYDFHVFCLIFSIFMFTSETLNVIAFCSQSVGVGCYVGLFVGYSELVGLSVIQ